jgi:hypothetical protein
MRKCSRLSCLQGQDLRVILAPFGSDLIHGVRPNCKLLQRVLTHNCEFFQMVSTQVACYYV